MAVVGAGPFGLSVAAHLSHLDVHVFGEEMATWKHAMPHGMLLRSAWEETSLSAPGGRGTIDAWVRDGGTRTEPIPVERFLEYGAWFADRFVPGRDASDVAEINAVGNRYRVTTTAGASLEADRVVVAVGVSPFAFVPGPFARLLGERVRLARGRDDAASLRGRRVLVVGGGQGGLESAGLAAQAGAEVELVTRSTVRWFADREPERHRGPIHRRLYRLAYPAVGYGPPPLNRLVLYPDVYARLPSSVKDRLTSRLLRPGGSPWLRPLVDGHVRLTEGTTVTEARETATALELGLSDGSTREVDVVLLACGHRFSVDGLRFLAPELRSRIAVERGWPVLDRFFRTTDPGIQLVGYPAEGRYGPISRFVLGTDFTARRVASAPS